jgi:flagellar basal-body rod protein FlgC
MSLFQIFNVSGSAVAAQSQRLNVVASNLANAESVAGPDGQPYKGREVVFQAVASPTDPTSTGVRVQSVVEDTAAPRRVYSPGHPQADEAGYVTMSNVNVVDEMVNMISASRGYQSNIDVMNTAKSMLQQTLQLGN